MFFSKVVENIKLNDRLFLKPEYLNHEFVSGNKWRKLKYNIKKAKNEGQTTLLSFGGAYSNHIAALASAGKIYDFKTIGVIRGEELESNYEDNPTLKYAKSCGMIFKFVSRDVYKMKDALHFINDLRNQFGAFMLIPEGGTNKLAIKGCEEIFNPTDIMFDYVCCCVGTGGTISGLINSSWPHQKILGFPALKGAYLNKDISKFAKRKNWELIEDYHFGGYAKINEELIHFMNNFKLKYNIQLDPVYTAKMIFGVNELINNGYFEKNAKILLIHSGGLQGIPGMNEKLRKKKLPLIN